MEDVCITSFFSVAEDKSDGKLEAIEAMVNSKRDNCLGHPLVLRFLNEKMNSSRIQKWFLFNILLYATLLFTLTAYSTIESHGNGLYISRLLFFCFLIVFSFPILSVLVNVEIKRKNGKI